MHKELTPAFFWSTEINAKIIGPVTGVQSQCERILRSLPAWFGIEASLLEYAENTNTLPTFIAEDNGAVIGFLSLRQHFAQSWEIDCIGVEIHGRNQGVGRALVSTAQDWLSAQEVVFLQVKTLAESRVDEAYAQTRKFYAAVGFECIQEFPTLWGERLPALQLLKVLRKHSFTN
jgi:N-acetylglutamate synthase-like GNAT family acetyltransferase